ncbi:hypothetical protein LOK49_LG13G00485 [Camellia lanceoleosa]|uniref:Uncharacterized protein n=1 Tax=Camellia lanceoleosa TaxID=1840588 RepID=A0ACC0FMK1_9ERIC|nr:hypothetical protein LOK49_LG13G00485 [Camellia lanceoleosa]
MAVSPINTKPTQKSLFSLLPKSRTLHSRTIISNTLHEINQTTQPSSAGKIKRLVLSPEGRTKLNAYPDRDFYAFPRFVTHVDGNFIATLIELYRERLSPGSEILDLASSWVSHLPKEVEYKRVVGHGLNAQELAKNPRLDYFFVKDLNCDQKLELESGCLDVVLCTVSVQYLQQPEKVIYNRETDQSRGFGFVTMSTIEEAEKAVEMFHRYAAPRGSRPERPSGAIEPSFRIYIGNLPWQVDNARLKQVFSEHGNVVDVKVVYDRDTGRSRGFGFVTMSSETEVNDAIAALDGQSLDGRAIRVNVAEDRRMRGLF